MVSMARGEVAATGMAWMWLIGGGIFRWGTSQRSNRLEGFDWFASGEGVEDVGTEVDTVGPHDGVGFGVYLDLFEEGRVFERAEHSASAEDAIGEVKLVDGAAGEG